MQQRGEEQRADVNCELRAGSHGLRPASFVPASGTVEAVPCQNFMQRLTACRCENFMQRLKHCRCENFIKQRASFLRSGHRDCGQRLCRWCL